MGKKRVIMLALIALLVSVGNAYGQAWEEYIDTKGLRWEYEEIEKGKTCRIELSDEKAVSGHVDIPSAVIAGGVEVIQVVELAQEAFKACRGMTSVTIPKGLRVIGDGAFNLCSGLKSIDIPEGVELVGDGAFSECSSLARVTLPKSTKSIGANAFQGCIALLEVRLPEGLEHLGRNAFYGCEKLLRFEMENASSDKFMELGGVVFSKDGRSLLLCPEGKSGEYVVPHGVEAIGDGAFQGCSQLTEVRLPRELTIIGESAFQSCSGLKSMAIPDGVKRISDYAFSGCRGMVELKLPSRLESIGEYAFAECEALSRMRIPDGVEELSRGTLAGCSQLVSLSIPSSMTAFRVDALTGCKDIMELRVATGNTAFEEQDGVLYSKDRKTLVYCPASRGGEFKIPDGVETIGQGAFYNCEGLTRVEIPRSVTSIGAFAFYNCSGLKGVKIPEGVKAIRNNTFSFCVSLRSVLLPGGITSIGEAAFSMCKGLSDMTIPQRVRSIGTRAFYSCYGLSDVYWLAKPRCRVSKDAFELISATSKLYVRHGEKARIVRVASGWWEKFGQIVEGNVVEFDAAGGDPEPATRIVEEGRIIEAPVDRPTRIGYTFMGWYLGGEEGSQYDFSSGVTGDITLAARWASKMASKEATAVESKLLAGTRVVENPAGWRFVLEGVLDADCVEVYSLTGVRLYARALHGEGRVEISVDSWPSGVYMVRVAARDGARVLRVVKP